MTPPARMDVHEKLKMRAAAERALKLYPGAVGELIRREILTWEEFGYRFGNGSIVERAVKDIMKARLPEENRQQFESAVGYGG